MPSAAPPISSRVSRTSAAVLALAGAALLFAPDAVVPALAPGFPPGALWLAQLLAQLLAAAWLGVAVLNWLQRATLLGGIYGRPLVFANVVLYFVGGMAVLRGLREPGAPRALWLVAVPMTLLAVVYGALMLRGPFDPLRAP
jgi:hypothetical protein